MTQPSLLGSVLFGADEMVADYVAGQLGAHTRFAGGYTALGVIRRGRFCGGVVYHNFCRLPHGNMIEVSFAFDDPLWALPATLQTVCIYPFVNLDCNRVTALVARSNKRSRQVVEKVGFSREGSHPRGMDGRETAISYGLLREDCIWINPRSEWARLRNQRGKHGQKHTVAA